MKDIKRKLEKKKGGKEGGTDAEKGGSRNEMKSSKFFKRLQDVVKGDKEKKDSKKRAKAEGGKDGGAILHSHSSAKKFKL